VTQELHKNLIIYIYIYFISRAVLGRFEEIVVRLGLIFLCLGYMEPEGGKLDIEQFLKILFLHKMAPCYSKKRCKKRYKGIKF
jgi:hypothetical protein